MLEVGCGQYESKSFIKELAKIRGEKQSVLSSLCLPNGEIASWVCRRRALNPLIKKAYVQRNTSGGQCVNYHCCL